jgi:hypothetical protein
MVRLTIYTVHLDGEAPPVVSAPLPANQLHVDARHFSKKRIATWNLRTQDSGPSGGSLALPAIGRVRASPSTATLIWRFGACPERIKPTINIVTPRESATRRESSRTRRHPVWPACETYTVWIQVHTLGEATVSGYKPKRIVDDVTRWHELVNVRICRVIPP